MACPLPLKKVDFGVSRWQLDEKNFIPGFVTSRRRFVEQRRPVSALVRDAQPIGH
jgi:hypothetical protein